MEGFWTFELEKYSWRPWKTACPFSFIRMNLLRASAFSGVQGAWRIEKSCNQDCRSHRGHAPWRAAHLSLRLFHVRFFLFFFIFFCSYCFFLFFLFFFLFVFFVVRAQGFGCTRRDVPGQAMAHCSIQRTSPLNWMYRRCTGSIKITSQVFDHYARLPARHLRRK